MPLIGIIRGVDEAYCATGYVIKLIRALNKRFRSKIKFIEIPLGDRIKHGYELNREVLDKILECDALFIGDIESASNILEYSSSDIAVALSNDIETLCISGIGEFSSVNVCVSSYFDGGAKLREITQNVEGCVETRVCSAYAAMNIAKYISRRCEARKRRLFIVKDSENEFMADMFYRYFENYIIPLSNFHLYKYNLRDLCTEIFRRPQDLDAIFTSKTASESIFGIYSGLMKEKFMSYMVYARNFPVYEVKSVCSNISYSGEIPSLYSYIAALSDMLYNEFAMKKEQNCLRGALEQVVDEGYSSGDASNFIEMLITKLNDPIKTKYTTQKQTRKYLK